MSIHTEPEAHGEPKTPGGLSVGGVAVRNAAFLAPMSGVTDAPFRRLAWRLGAGLVVSEMTASEALATGCDAARLRAERAGNGPHVVQLAGCEARWLAEGARMAEAAGADIIDINMGCPARRVTSGFAGSALMRDLDHAVALIAATVQAVSVPVTLKMRLGWDAASLNAPELARRAEMAGVQMITVHGRTRCQFYQGHADWSAVRAVKTAVTLPVVVNGDIASPGDAATALRRSGADAVMIGRAALGHPWLAGQIAHSLAGAAIPPAPPLTVQKQDLIELYDDILSHHGSAVGLRHARKHLRASIDVATTAFGSNLPEPVARARTAALTSEQPVLVIHQIGEIYAAAAQRMAA
jgi:nifR3 family TIM-barrel protein